MISLFAHCYMNLCLILCVSQDQVPPDSCLVMDEGLAERELFGQTQNGDSTSDGTEMTTAQGNGGVEGIISRGLLSLTASVYKSAGSSQLQ